MEGSPGRCLQVAQELVERLLVGIVVFPSGRRCSAGHGASPPTARRSSSPSHRSGRATARAGHHTSKGPHGVERAVLCRQCSTIMTQCWRCLARATASHRALHSERRKRHQKYKIVDAGYGVSWWSFPGGMSSRLVRVSRPSQEDQRTMLTTGQTSDNAGAPRGQSESRLAQGRSCRH